MTIQELKRLKTSTVLVKIGEVNQEFIKEIKLPASAVSVLDEHGATKQAKILSAIGDDIDTSKVSSDQLLKSIDKSVLLDLMKPTATQIDELFEALSQQISINELENYLLAIGLDEDFLDLGKETVLEELYITVNNQYEEIKAKNVKKDNTPSGGAGVSK